jgi:internalin A
MKALVEKMPSLKADPSLALAENIAETTDPDRAEGAALRSMRLLLDRVDPQQQWGGLRKILTPEGHYLWLCSYHATEYLT